MTGASHPDPRRLTDRELLELQVADLQASLATIAAGGVDGIVVSGASGTEVYTLTSGDKPYRVMLEEMGEGAVMLSPTGLILYANRRFCEILGIERSGLLGRDLRTLVAPAGRDQLTELSTLPLGVTRRIDLDLDLGDGATRRNVQVAATGIDQGGVPLAVLIFTDVTDRHRTSALLAEAAQRFSAVFDEAPLGMALVDATGMVLRCNSILLHLLATPSVDVVGKDFADFFHVRDRAALRVELQAIFGRRRSLARRELRLDAAGRTHSWVSLSASLVTAGSGDQAVVQVEDISASKAYEQRLEVLADHDHLTGLFNRRRFREELNRWLSSVDRYGTPGAVLLLDLDNFKYVNDTLGHQTGDRLLQQVGQALTTRARRTDVVGRLGGDEFGAILPATKPEEAMRVAESYLAMLRGTEFEDEGIRMRVTASAGMVVVERTENRSAEELLADADVAMYEAKELGRDTVTMFDPASVQVTSWRERFHSLDMVHRAIEEDGFALHAQPILNLASGEVDGYELLVRLVHDGTIIPPSGFLDVAESHGLGPVIDKWVVRHALENIVSTFGAEADLRWEINLSAASLGDDSLVGEIERSLASTGVPPGDVVFEITETAAIAHLHQAQRFVQQVTDLGCRFAMDDFGAGYGSFYYLKHLPFDFLKIDGEFVRDLATEPRDRTIVASIITAARALGKVTIAEYVQDDETVTWLREIGVDYGQGFHIGRPQPMAEALRLRSAARSRATGAEPAR